MDRKRFEFESHLKKAAPPREEDRTAPIVEISLEDDELFNSITAPRAKEGSASFEPASEHISPSQNTTEATSNSEDAMPMEVDTATRQTSVDKPSVNVEPLCELPGGEDVGIKDAIYGTEVADNAVEGSVLVGGDKESIKETSGEMDMSINDQVRIVGHRDQGSQANQKHITNKPGEDAATQVDAAAAAEDSGTPKADSLKEKGGHAHYVVFIELRSIH